MNLLHTGEETLMKRRIIKIDENKCNGCGLCAKACHEGAIGMVNGKAKLLRDDYCDGQRCGLKEKLYRPRGSALAPAYA